MSELAFKLFLAIHIVAGMSSLILFWVPVVARKGSINHRRVGKIYVNLMWLVVASAALMSIINLFSSRVVQSIFLGFLALLTAKPLWLGIAVLKHKREPGPGFLRTGLALNGTLLIAGLALIAFGISLLGETVALLMIAFGALGMLGLPDIIATLKSNVDGSDWLHAHIGDMIVSGIAAHTAFFAFGASQFTASIFTGNWVTVPWLAPTVIGTIGIIYARAKFPGTPAKTKAVL
ncbi:MAG: hypothetical protein AB8B48_20605 [Pseudomonadales bacterium]